MDGFAIDATSFSRNKSGRRNGKPSQGLGQITQAVGAGAPRIQPSKMPTRSPIAPTGARGKLPGSQTGPRARPPQNRRSTGNPFAAIVRKSI